ncbi:MAG: hypothetical protein U0353_26720 [Sandaracinus sp.]
MIENLFRPWLLARVVVGLSAAALAIAAMVVASRALLRDDVRATSASRLALDKQIELVSTLFSLAGAFAWLDLLLAVSGADRLAGSLRGAMCAYGVLASSAWGFRALVLAILSALAASSWRALHAIDLTQREGVLTRAKLVGAFFVGPLVVASFVASTRFALDLDFRVIASCCSTGFGPRAASVLGRDGGAEPQAMLALVILGVLAAALALVSTRVRNERSAAIVAGLASLASLGAAIASVPAIVGYVAPHAYETPVHQCPFCLLRVEESGGIGWPLYAALALALGSSLALGISAIASSRVPEPALAIALRRRFARSAAVGWLVAVAVAIYPVARFAWISGGASLFG